MFKKNASPLEKASSLKHGLSLVDPTEISEGLSNASDHGFAFTGILPVTEPAGRPVLLPSFPWNSLETFTFDHAAPGLSNASDHVFAFTSLPAVTNPDWQPLLPPAQNEAPLAGGADIGHSSLVGADHLAVLSESTSRGSSAATSTSTATSTTSKDITPPKLISTVMDPISTGGDPNIVVTFSEPITAGSGHITVLTSTGTVVEKIPVTDLNRISISDSTLRIDPTALLQAGANYTVSFDSTAIKDRAGNIYKYSTLDQTSFKAEPTSGGSDSWTIMIYMAADNDLESFAISDLNELESAYTSQFGSHDYNFVVLADRSSSYSTASGNWADTRVGAITYGTTSDVTSPLASWGELNTGDPSTLTNFVKWTTAQTQYQAANYGLVIWDHGSGLDGVAWDYTSNDHLTVSELSTAINNTGVHFGFIGFDACLMSMTEIAYDLRPGAATDGYADFIVGSQDLEPGNGWAYDKWLQGIASSGFNQTAADLVTGAVNTFAAAYPTSKGIALSAVETAEMGSFIASLNGFTQAALSLPATSSDIQMMTSAAQTAYEFGGGKDEYIDLGQFMAQVAAKAIDPTLRTAAATVLPALDDAVLWEAGTVGAGSGLSIYLPAGNEAISSTYTESNLAFLQPQGVPLWDDFLRLI